MPTAIRVFLLWLIFLTLTAQRGLAAGEIPQSPDEKAASKAAHAKWDLMELHHRQSDMSSPCAKKLREKISQMDSLGSCYINRIDEKDEQNRKPCEAVPEGSQKPSECG